MSAGRASAWEQFRRDLLLEQFGKPTPEYHAPKVGISVEERYDIQHDDRDVPAVRRLRAVA